MISIRCANRACYLNTEQLMPDVVAAEILAKVHEDRFADADLAHVIMVKLSDPAASSEQGGKGAFPIGGAHA